MLQGGWEVLLQGDSDGGAGQRVKSFIYLRYEVGCSWEWKVVVFVIYSKFNTFHYTIKVIEGNSESRMQKSLSKVIYVILPVGSIATKK